MSTINDSGPAFPTRYHEDMHGMTLRDWFAGQALAGLLAKYGLGEAEPESMAADSYAYADAMLRVREVKP
jgi:hypothetical protein